MHVEDSEWKMYTHLLYIVNFVNLRLGTHNIMGIMVGYHKKLAMTTPWYSSQDSLSSGKLMASGLVANHVVVIRQKGHVTIYTANTVTV